MTLTHETAAAVSAAGLSADGVEDIVHRCLAEDLGTGVDVTSVATVAFDAEGVADLVPRADGVIAGLPLARAVLDAVTDDSAAVTAHAGDGDRVRAGEPLLSVVAPTRALLTAERTMLNLACHCSGVASLTRAFVDAVAGTGAGVLDTRKTTPGLRMLDKYAVRCGGGANKRLGLYDAALVKDNHALAAGGVAAALGAVRATFADVTVQVECDTVEQVAAALGAGATFLLCDNMPVPALAEAVRLAAGRAQVEATGGITLASARRIAETGVDYLSVGALTHSAPALDIGLDLRAEG
jgi:nicotinate-nucleotide pyrophosphorylase (carboxylating)